MAGKLRERYKQKTWRILILYVLKTCYKSESNNKVEKNQILYQ